MEKYFQHPLIKTKTIQRRRYQEILLASCVKRNSLIVLPTGLGKTIIAVLISAFRLNKFPSSKIVFLAPTKPLVQQHFYTFKNVLTLEESFLTILTGYNPSKERKLLWSNSKVIFITPQTLQNDIINSRISLSSISLLIFDEAHRAIGNYAYTFIAEKYLNTADNPLILALTASPGTEEKIHKIIKNLFIENIEIRTETSKDVLPFIQPLKIEKKLINLPQEFKQIKLIIEKKLKYYLKKLKDHKFITTINLTEINKKDLLTIQSKIQNKLKSGEKKTEYFESAKNCAIAIKLSHMLELLETQGLTSLNKYLNNLKAGRKKSDLAIINDPEIEELEQLTQELILKNVDHPKVEALKQTIKDQLRRNETSRIIVFTHYRISAQNVVEVLTDLEMVHPIRFVGQQSKRDDKGISQKRQIEILEKFRDGGYNVLVATSVAEEGLDIVQCDLVIFYDAVPSSIRAIQRRGRTGRGRPGKVIMLIAKGTRDEGYYWASVSRERKMKETLKELQKGSIDIIKIKKKSKTTTKQTKIDKFFENEK